MTTILFCVKTKKISINNIKKQLKSIIHKDIVLHFLTEKNNEIVDEINQLKPDKTLPVQLSIYPVGTSEESMIENGVKNLPNTKFVLVRDNANFSADLIEKLITESLLGFDIVMAKKLKKENFFSEFFSKLSKKLCNLFFNFTFYEGDIGTQFFSEQAHSIMKTTNVAMLTKLNRWIALNINYIEFDFEKTIIKNKKFENNIIKASVYLGLFVLTLAGAIVFNAYIAISFIGWLVLVFACIAFLALGLRSLMDIYVVSKIGNIYCENVSVIERKEI